MADTSTISPTSSSSIITNTNTSSTPSTSTTITSSVPSIGGALASGTTPSLTLSRSLQCPPETLHTMPPMDLFIAQISCDSAEARVDAMKRLYTVASAIGTEPTLGRLLPYLATNIAMEDDEDDEILLLLGEQLGLMVPNLIPGYRALSILPILERLAAVEETVVREKAVESINKIVPLLLDMPSSAAGAGAGASSSAASVGSGNNSTMNDGEMDSITVDADGSISTGGDISTTTNNTNTTNSAIAGGAASKAASSTIDAAPALLLAMAKRLAGADWFTAKVSAAGVLPALYRFYNQHEKLSSGKNEIREHDREGRRELRALYRDLVDDDTPMVRRSAARHLGRFIEAVADSKCEAKDVVFATSSTSSSSSMYHSNMHTVSKEIREVVTNEMVPLFQGLANDEQDSVRLLAVSNAGSVGAGLGCDPNVTAELVLGVVRAGCTDLSWRVRNNLAKEFATVAYNMGFADSPAHAARQTEIFAYFSSLLQDAEAEVRAAAVANVARMTHLGGPDLFQSHIASVLPQLADDPVMEVRSKLAETLMDCFDDSICTALSDRIILQVVKPLLEGFLNDEFAEVQLHILTKLSRVSHLLNKMDVVVSSILQMTKAQNWRVREAVARLLPHLAEARGVSFFEDHLLEPWLKLLLDQVADVRSACVNGMPKLLSVAGAAWIQREILPHYVRIYEESASNYLTRITIIRSYAALAVDRGGSTNPSLLDEIVNQMLRGLDDRVANVRMVAARGLANISEYCEDAILNAKIRPALNARVTDDEDADCKYFAQVALEACS